MKNRFVALTVSAAVLLLSLGSAEAVKPDKRNKQPADVSGLITKIEVKKELLGAFDEKIKVVREADKQAMLKEREERIRDLEKKDPARASLMRDKMALAERENKLNNGKPAGKKKGDRALGMSQLKARNPMLFAMLEERKGLQAGIKGLEKQMKQTLKGNKAGKNKQAFKRGKGRAMGGPLMKNAPGQKKQDKNAQKNKKAPKTKGNRNIPR